MDSSFVMRQRCDNVNSVVVAMMVDNCKEKKGKIVKGHQSNSKQQYWYPISIFFFLLCNNK